MSRLHFYVGAHFTVPGLDLFTFWSRKHAGGEIAAQNGCLATINELALAARAPGKDFHHCVLLGHSFGGLVLENTISHSILDASGNGSRNSSPLDMAVAFNPADSSIGRPSGYATRRSPITWTNIFGSDKKSGALHPPGRRR